VNENERKVLGCLAYDYNDVEWRAWYFRGLVKERSPNRRNRTARFAARSEKGRSP
jgi:hypothetical protein